MPGAWDIVSGIQQRIEITAYKDNFVELQVQIVYKGKMRESLKPFFIKGLCMFVVMNIVSLLKKWAQG